VSETYNSGDTVLFIFPDGTGPALLSCLIAGIPLNRAHELDFAPGEVRMDMTYDSIRALLPAEPTPAYLKALERGKVELKRLQTVDGVVSEREAQYAQQVQEQEAAAAKWAKDNSDRREERQQRSDAAAADRKAAFSKKTDNLDNQRTYGESSRNEIGATSSEANVGKKKIDGANPLLFSVATLGLLSTFKPAYDLSEDLGKKESSGSTNIQEDATIVDTTPIGVQGEEDESHPPASPISKFTELDVIEDLVEEAAFEIPEFEAQTTAGSGLYGATHPAPIRTEEQLASDALEAMEEYLNRDDGAEDFDYLMAQLIDGDEQV
jgi:hypothetical protein